MLFSRAAGSWMAYVGWGGHWDRVGPGLEPEPRGILDIRRNLKELQAGH